MLGRSYLDSAGEHAKEIHACPSDIVNHFGDETKESVERNFLEIGPVVPLSMANVTSGAHEAIPASSDPSHRSATVRGGHAVALLKLRTCANAATFGDAWPSS